MCLARSPIIIITIVIITCILTLLFVKLLQNRYNIPLLINFLICFCSGRLAISSKWLYKDRYKDVFSRISSSILGIDRLRNVLGSIFKQRNGCKEPSVSDITEVTLSGSESRLEDAD